MLSINRHHIIIIIIIMIIIVFSDSRTLWASQSKKHNYWCVFLGKDFLMF